MQFLSSNFSTEPYWWADFKPPEDVPTAELPKSVDVIVVGAGYAGVSCARTLASERLSVLVLDAGRLGGGASTRSGGQITGGVNIGKTPNGKAEVTSEAYRRVRAAMLRECADGMSHLEQLLDLYQIECGYQRTGRLTACWLPEHYDQWERKLDEINELTDAGAYMVPRQRMHEEIASDKYFGGAVISRAGHLQPAKLYGGLLKAARSHGAQVYGMSEVTGIVRGQDGVFLATTARGTIRASEVVLATNGYPSAILGRLRRQIVPVTSNMIATAELPEER